MLGERLPLVRHLLGADPHVFALFISPTGDGIKVIFRVPVCADQQQHAMGHQVVAARINDLCKAQIDATSDIDRLCYASFDPDAYLNPNAAVLPVKFEPVQKADTQPHLACGSTNSDPSERQAIAEEVLGPVVWESAIVGLCRCPGQGRHTNENGERDCKVWLDGVPSIKCMHTSCAPIVEGVNHTLRSRIAKAESNGKAQVSATHSVPSNGATELDYADSLAEKLPPIRTCGGNWYMFKEGVWQPTDRAILLPDAQKILPPSARTAHRASAVLDHLEGRFQIQRDSWLGFHKITADGAVLLNVANGVLRVESPGKITVEPHSREHGFTRRISSRYDPKSGAPLFLRVLGEALPDSADQALYQLCAGNFLYPDCRFEAALVCYGETGRGKSTLAEPIIEALGQSVVPRLSMSQICDPRSYHLPKLQFAAVNIGTELDAIELGDSGPFKAIVSGERLEARPIYGAPFTMQTACKLWFLANVLPRFKYGTEAEMRRLRFLRFHFLPLKKDVTLKSKLALERDGVFQWMLAGLVKLLNQETIPFGGSDSQLVHRRFGISNDPVGAFVSNSCRLDSALKVSKETLAAAYKGFRERHDLPNTHEGSFFRTLYERWPQVRESRPAKTKGHRPRYLLGIGLTT